MWYVAAYGTGLKTKKIQNIFKKKLISDCRQVKMYLTGSPAFGLWFLLVFFSDWLLMIGVLYLIVTFYRYEPVVPEANASNLAILLVP